MDKLSDYLVGLKLAGKEELILREEALEKAEEDCVVLVIPKSKWEGIKEQEIPG
jgi:hypothetical protein